ncbi:MAG: ATP-binding cassette domain-containing protein, partial [Acholeplasmataceae bacterium]
MIKLTINEKSFPTVLIFKNASIELSKGSFIAIKGPSGSGKTTLMRMIGLLDNFDGEYYYENLLIKTSDS